MSNRTAMKRKHKKYTGVKNVRNSFGRVYASFGPIIDWFELQLTTGETIVNEHNEPCVITHKQNACPTWEAIEAMLDLNEVATGMKLFSVNVAELEMFKKSLKFDSLVTQSVFEKAYKQLIEIRDATFRVPAAKQVALAETTQMLQMVEVAA